MPLGKEVGLGL